MGIHTLQRMAYQPYYHVLVSDGSNRYAAEEDLEPLNRPGTNITHGQVSRIMYARDRKSLRLMVCIYFDINLLS